MRTKTPWMFYALVAVTGIALGTAPVSIPLIYAALMEPAHG